MNLVTTKVLVAVLFGFVRFFCGTLPINIYLFLKFWQKEEVEGAAFINDKRLKQVNCNLALFQSFSGGVLFATCFLHMMPGVYECVIELRKYGDVMTKFPYSQLIICVGFFVVYFIEEISYWFLNCTIRNCKKVKVLKKTGVVTPEVEKFESPNNEDNLSPGINALLEDRNLPKNISGFVNVEKPFVVEQNGGSNEKNGFHSATKEKFNEEKSGLTTIDGYLDVMQLPRSKNGFFKDVDSDEESNDGDKDEEENQPMKELEKIIDFENKTRQQILSCILIVLALSSHALMEGLAIGLQQSMPDIWYLFTAVSIHSAAILFSTTLEGLIAHAKIKTILVQVILLSATSPLGVLIGLVITLTTDMDTHAKSVAIVFLEGFSAGTILYITFFEVLKREKERRVYSFRRAIFILAGFALMAVLEYAEVYH